MSKFEKGQQVQSSTDAQGLKKGAKYEVVAVYSRHLLGMEYTTVHVVALSDRGRFENDRSVAVPVTNAHILLNIL